MLLLRRYAIDHPSPEIERQIDTIQKALAEKQNLLASDKAQRLAQRRGRALK